MILGTCKKCGEPFCYTFPRVTETPEYKRQDVFVKQLLAIVNAKLDDNYVVMMDLIEEADRMLDFHDTGDAGEKQ
jgi:hypothetical protein